MIKEYSLEKWMSIYLNPLFERKKPLNVFFTSLLFSFVYTDMLRTKLYITLHLNHTKRIVIHFNNFCTVSHALIFI
jgi:hypothetical protein